ILPESCTTNIRLWATFDSRNSGLSDRVVLQPMRGETVPTQATRPHTNLRKIAILVLMTTPSAKLTAHAHSTLRQSGAFALSCPDSGRQCEIPAARPLPNH